MAANIYFIFEYKGERVYLPYNPDSLKVKRGGNNETVSVMSLGEINIMKRAKLFELELVSFFPSEEDFHSLAMPGEYVSPGKMINFFKLARRNCEPMLLTVTGTAFGSQYVCIESFDWGVSAGCGDVDFTLSLREYRKPKIKTESASESGKPAAEERMNPEGKISTGSKVSVNGRLYADADGNGAGKTLNNFSGTVNIVKDGAIKSYHIIALDGSSMGWVEEDSLTFIAEGTIAMSGKKMTNTMNMQSAPSSSNAAGEMAGKEMEKNKQSENGKLTKEQKEYLARLNARFNEFV